MKHIKVQFSLIAIGFVFAFATSCGNDGTPSDSTDLLPGGAITYGNMTDVEGNSYKTVTIGTQTWMAENLRVTKYKDGTAIPLVLDQAAWASLKTPGYCWYSNDATANKGTNGGLYNWYAVNTGKLAPTGWHVPTNTEWQALITYMQGIDIADKRYSLNITTLADVAKSMSLSTGWVVSSVAGTPGNSDFPTYVNKSGFSAIPSGSRCNLGALGFSDIGYTGFWWTSVDLGASLGSMAWGYYISYNKCGTLLTTPNKFWGISVRCVKDN